LRGVNIFLAVSVSSLVVFGFCLGGGGTGFGNFFRTVATPRPFPRVARDCASEAASFFLVESDQDLPGFNWIALANQDLINAPTDVRADANVAGFNGAGARGENRRDAAFQRNTPRAR